MAQLYFLSILFNGLTGYVLIAQESWENNSKESILKFSPQNETFRLVLGILTAVTGLLKLLSPVGGSIPILGDLVPAVFGLGAGLVLLLGYYREHADLADNEGKFGKFYEVFLRWKKGIGITLLVSALLHFLFPQALFL